MRPSQETCSLRPAYRAINGEAFNSCSGGTEAWFAWGYMWSKIGESCARAASATVLIRRSGWFRGTRSPSRRWPACCVGDGNDRVSGIPLSPSGQSSLLVARGGGIGDHALHCSDSVFAARVRRQFANPLPDVPGNNRSRLVHIHCSVTQLLIVNAGIKFRDGTPVDGRGPR